MSQKVVIDDRQWPILVVTQMVEQLTDPERAESLEASDRVLTSHGGDIYGMVLDNRKAGPLPPTQRKLMAEYMARRLGTQDGGTASGFLVAGVHSSACSRAQKEHAARLDAYR